MFKKLKNKLSKKEFIGFFEVSLGLTKKEAQKETERCLQCKNPLCVKGCPVGIDIPAFIKLIKEGKQKEALLKIKEKNNLPAVCGRVCPQENQCEAACILNKKKIPINIGALERYASEYNLKPATGDRRPETTKVAVVGSGPAGLTCAADLAKMHYAVTLFESLHVPGGVLFYGIPEFRLPKKIIEEEIDYIKSLGVEIITDVLIGKTITIEDLFKQGYGAIFIATGAGLPQFLNIPGENLNMVYSANEFLTRINLMKANKFPKYHTPINIGKNVAVVGGGNVAVDCARVALRLGKKVHLVYRRTENEMPARKDEVIHAKEEGVNFQLLSQPVKIISDNNGFVTGLECIKMSLGPADESGRQRPIPIENSNFILKVDTVIVAIGQNPNPLLLKSTPKLLSNENGTVKIDKNLMTSIEGVFAGGDITTGADTVIQAMGAGKMAAKQIDVYLKNKLKNGN